MDAVLARFGLWACCKNVQQHVVLQPPVDMAALVVDAVVGPTPPVARTDTVCFGAGNDCGGCGAAEGRPVCRRPH